MDYKYYDALRKNGKYQEEIDKLAKVMIEQIGTGKSVLITGGTGTIGSEQVDAIMWANEHYDANINLYIQARDIEKMTRMFSTYLDSPLFHIDARNITQGIDTSVSYDAIFHYACNADPATYKEFPKETRDGIIEGTRKVLQYAIEHPDCKIMYASTMEYYGKKPYEEGLDIKETDEAATGLNPDDWRDYAYSLAKVDAEKMCQDAVKAGAHVTIGRFPYMFGPTHAEGNSLAINQWLDKARHGETVEVKSGTASHMFRKFESVADGLRYAAYQLNAPNGDAANLIGIEKQPSFLETAQYIASLGNSKFIAAAQDSIDSEATRALNNNCLNGDKINLYIAKMPSKTERIYKSVKDAFAKCIDIMKEVDISKEVQTLSNQKEENQITADDILR